MFKKVLNERSWTEQYKILIQLKEIKQKQIKSTDCGINYGYNKNLYRSYFSEDNKMEVSEDQFCFKIA